MAKPEFVPVATSTLSRSDYTKRKEVFLDIYDEQLQFMTPNGNYLPHIEYTLLLGNGDLARGVTDEEGKTKRISTGNKAQSIVKAELTACQQSCCAAQADMDITDSESVVVDLKGVATTPNAVGTSVKVVTTPDGESRGLTAGEIAMAKLVYADSIDYSTVKVHKGGYWLLFGFQPSDTAVTPNGEIYFKGGNFREDYSAELVGMQGWFIHEMAHVWQYQLGYPVKWVRTPRPKMTYDYTLDPNKKLCDYNMEAQGDILADYFLAGFRNARARLRNENYQADPDVLSLLKQTLSDFLKNPKDAGNLPKTTK